MARHANDRVRCDGCGGRGWVHARWTADGRQLLFARDEVRACGACLGRGSYSPSRVAELAGLRPDEVLRLQRGFRLRPKNAMRICTALARAAREAIDHA